MTISNITCPFCQFTKAVHQRTIPENARWVTCPKCEKRFSYPPQATTFAPSAAPWVDPERDQPKPQNVRLAVLFLTLFLALLGGRLYTAHRAQSAPAPKFIAASTHGIATLWLDQIMVTDPDGVLLKQIAIPDDVIPVQMIWAGDELWIGDYQTKRILIVGDDGQRWLTLNGPKISAHFKVEPDFAHGRLFVSNGAGHSIHVYDLQGAFLSSFGTEGGRPGQLRFPNQFLVENSGDLLISNTKSPGIDRFTPEGEFLGRVVTPMGHLLYRYPTKVDLSADRIFTLENDGYLRDGRIASYSLEGRYLGSQEPVQGFTLIGDIAVWDERVFATDLEHAKVYAFAGEDLGFLGEYSGDLKRLGEESRGDRRRYERLSSLSLLGMLLLMVPVIYLYVRFKKKHDGPSRAPVARRQRIVESLGVNSRNRLVQFDLSGFQRLDFIAVKTRSSIDILAAVIVGVPFFGMPWLALGFSSYPQEIVFGLLIVGMMMFGVGLLLSLRTSWGCPVSLKKARKLLGKLVKNKGTEMLEGVEKVGIGHCVDKATVLLLMASDHLVIAEFNIFGLLSSVFKVGYDGIAVEKKQLFIPAFTLGFGAKKKVFLAADKPFMTLLRKTLEGYLNQSPSEEPMPGVESPDPKKMEREHPAGRNEMGKPQRRKAALLSALYPGLGQFYKRDIGRGALFMTLYTPVVFIMAVSSEAIIDGSIDWALQSQVSVGVTLYFGLIVLAFSIWDALRN